MSSKTENSTSSTPSTPKVARIEVSRSEFGRRLAAHGHDPVAIEELWVQLTKGEPSPTEERELGLGAMIAVGLGIVLMVAALGSLLALYWEALDPWGVLALGSAYLTGFLVAGELLRRRRLTQPANLLQAIALGFVALVVYAIEQAAGLWPDTDVSYIVYGVTVIAASVFLAGIALLAVRPNPLLFLPIGAATGVLAVDAAEAVFGNDLGDRQRMTFLLPVGLAWMAVGLWLDVRGRRDEAEWAHWVGLVAAWVALPILLLPAVAGFVVLGVLGALSMFFSAFVRHWSYTVVGALGVMVAVTGGLQRLGGAAPLGAAVLGIGLIVVGLRWSRWRDTLRDAVLDRMPTRMRALVMRLAP